MSDSPRPWSVLHVDDVPAILDLVAEIVRAMPEIGGREFEVDSREAFGDGLEALREKAYDIVILDVRAGDPNTAVNPEQEAGRRLLQQIKETRFVPVVFYTGLPQVVEDLAAAPLVQVQQKGKPTGDLEAALLAVVESGLPSLRRGLEGHLVEVLREYMWDFVATHHEAFGGGADPTDYLYLLLRRLSRSITGALSAQLADEMGLDIAASASGGKVPPMRYYVMPPVEADPHLTGDIYKADLSAHAPGSPFHPPLPVPEPDEPESGDTDDGGLDAPDRTGFWVLITPACDLALRHDGSCKADNVILARAEGLGDQTEMVEWKADVMNGTKKGRVKSLLQNRRQRSQPDRFHYLPGAFDLPHLIVDFQQVLAIPREALSDDGVIRVATLDEPYGAELISRFTNYLNRIGSPDLDVDSIMESLVPTL